jgi:SSS family solute:Na+ symporter
LNNLSLIDSSIVFLYLVAMVAIGWVASRRQEGVEDYYVAGRRQGSFSIACLWMASFIGGASIIGGSGKAYQMGITAAWYVTGLCIGCFLFGLTFAARVKRLGDAHGHMTYPDLIEHHYDSRTRIITTLTTVIAFIAYAAGQLAAAGSVLHVLLGWDFSTGLLVASGVVILYTAFGGYLAVTWTDWVQFVLLLIGIVLIGLPIAILNGGTPANLAAHLPASHFDIGAWGWPTITAMVVSMSLSFFTAMDSYTRCFAARNPVVARRGALMAVLFMFPIAVAATWMGLTAGVLFPGIESGDDVLTRFVLELFPTGLKGLMLVGILAAIMSTADICILTASANVTRDVWQRYIRPGMEQGQMVRMGTFASLAAGVLATLLAWKMQSVLDILLLAFTLNSAALFLPTLAAVFGKRASSSAAFWSISLSLLTVIAWHIAGSMRAGNTEWGAWFSIEPLWPGLLVSALTFGGLDWLHRKRA